MKGILRINQPTNQQSPSQSTSDRNERSRSDRRTVKSDVQFKCYTHDPKMKTSGIASSASCKTVPSKLKNEVQSEMIRPKKTTRLIKSVSNITKTVNKFEKLEIEECFIVEKEIQKENFHIKQKKKEKAEISNFKVIKKGWQKYETKNIFEVLTDNDEEDINKILFKTRILKTSKSSLKRCKRCNFKKRSCILNPSTCKAINKCCIKCQKIGHFPQSPNCKARAKANKSQKSKIQIISEDVDQRKLCANALFLINRRISQLESEASSNSIKEQCNKDTSHQIPVDLIPFLSMYIFLNYDSFCNRNKEIYQMNEIE